MIAKLYFVAFFKHEPPPHIEEGPFVDLGAASQRMAELNAERKYSSFCVVSTEHEFTLEDA